jgi:hypothetical protein
MQVTVREEPSVALVSIVGSVASLTANDLQTAMAGAVQNGQPSSKKASARRSSRCRTCAVCSPCNRLPRLPHESSARFSPTRDQIPDPF